MSVGTVRIYGINSVPVVASDRCSKPIAGDVVEHDVWAVMTLSDTPAIVNVRRSGDETIVVVAGGSFIDREEDTVLVRHPNDD